MGGVARLCLRRIVRLRGGLPYWTGVVEDRPMRYIKATQIVSSRFGFQARSQLEGHVYTLIPVHLLQPLSRCKQSDSWRRGYL
jgi:hypothetical protein